MLSSIWIQFGGYRQQLYINEMDEFENRLLPFEVFIFDALNQAVGHNARNKT
jgi:hypothetical protein